MTDDLAAVVHQPITVQLAAPAPELPPGDSNLAAPTAEQQFVADHVFTDPHPAATLLGVLTSAMLLRDVAIDTFDTKEEDAEEKRRANEPEA